MVNVKSVSKKFRFFWMTTGRKCFGRKIEHAAQVNSAPSIIAKTLASPSFLQTEVSKLY